MLYLYFILLFILFKSIRRKNALNTGLYIIYLISALSAIILIFIDSEDSIIRFETEYTPIVYLLFIELFFINAFNDLSFKSKNFKIYKEKILILSNRIGWFYVPVVILLLYNDINVLTNVDLSSYRLEADYYSTGLFKGGKVLSLCIYLSELFFVPQFLFFYVLPYKDVKTSLKLRLLLSSFSFVFMTLMFAGRDGIVFWIMNSAIFFLLFRDSYSKNVIRKIRIGGVFVLAIALIPFIAISIARFYITGTGSFTETIAPFVSYIGQGPHIFCQSFNVDPDSIKGYEMSSLSTKDIQNLQLHLGWTFGTFVRSLIWSFGKFGGVLVSLLFYFTVRVSIQMFNRKHDIWSFFIIWMLFQIPFWGVFYYRYSINSIDIVYLIFAFICIIFYKKTKILSN